MGAVSRRILAAAARGGVLAALCLSTTSAQSQPAEDSGLAHPMPVALPRSTISDAPGSEGQAAREVWSSRPPMDALRGAAMCTFDNGPPLDDGGHPASQVSDAADPDWQFIAGAADDFEFAPGDPGMNCQITSIRAAFYFYGPNAGLATPTTAWEGVFVHVYADNMGQPAGMPVMGGYDGAQTGTVVASRYVLATSLENVTAVNTCTPSFTFDIPVELTVQRGVRYWLSIVPKHVAPPQSAWCLSQTAASGYPARQGFEYPAGGSILFWTGMPSNLGSPGCAGAPPSNTRRNLSFALTGVEVPAESGACCTDSGPMQGCVSSVDALDCQGVNQRFLPGATDCDALDPPCGMGGPGACCLGDGVCQVASVVVCQNAGGTWNAGTCAEVICPPPNGRCDHAIMVSDGIYPFDTTNALTDGPDSPLPPCTPVNQDIWYRYMATCTGTLTVSLCGSSFDTAVAIYQGAGCPPPQGSGLGPQLSCKDDFCGTGSRAAANVTAGQAYTIRVGGKDTASGVGSMSVGCVPQGMGACCLPMRGCLLTDPAECAALAGTFTLARPCVGDTCPTPFNDNCAGAITVTSGGSYAFDTRGATTDGPVIAGPGCATPEQDVWFSYIATCTGTLQLSLCGGTSFDSVIAVYAGCVCPPAGSELGCNNDGCGPAGGASALDVQVTSGQCYLIRIGGVGAAVGQGQLHLRCFPTGYGACCRPSQMCDFVPQAMCAGLDDQFYAGLYCWEVTCNPAPPQCCKGDINGDGVVDGEDADGFANALANLVDQTGNMACRLDMNGDQIANALDIQFFIDYFGDPPTERFCCCSGDMNLDGRRDGKDIQGFVDALLAPNQPSIGTAEFCLLNTEHDFVINTIDVDEFVTILLNRPACPSVP